MSNKNLTQSPYRFRPTFSRQPVQQTPALYPSSSRSHGQFASAPKFGTGKKEKAVRWHDDSGIEDPESSPTLPSRTRFSSSSVINNEGDTALNDQIIPQDRPFSHTKAIFTIEDHEEDVVVDTIESSADVESSTDELTNPLSRKRRRTGRQGKEAIEISSSPSHSPCSSLSEIEHLDKTQGSDLSSSDIDSPTTSKTPLRFRPTDTGSPYRNTTFLTHKPPFRIPPPRDESTSHVGLPEAFSPSKRRGKGKDYVPDGLADTLRGWILGLTAEERDQNHLHSAQSYKPIMRVSQLRRDANDRSVTVEDEDNRIVMLLGGNASQRRQDLRVGSRIGLRGGQMYWEIEAQLSSHQTRTQIGISAQWDVLEF